MGKRVYAFVGAMVALLFLAGTYAQAASPCDDLVVDDAGVFGNGMAQVTSEAQKLAGLGVDVRVRTIKTFGSAGNLDQYEDIVEKECASWRSPKGDRKNNLVVLMVSTTEGKRAIGLYYGGQWERALKPQWPRIEGDLMIPRFKDTTRFKEGDYSGGFVAGIKEIARLIDADLHPPVSQPGGSVVVVQPAESSPPPDLSGLWWVFGVMAVGGVGFVTFRGVSGYRKEQAERRGAQQKARLNKQAAADRIIRSPERLPILEAQANAVARQLSPSEASPLQSKLAEVKSLYASAEEQFANLGNSAGDPDRPGLSIPEYQNMERAYQTVLDTAQKADHLCDEVSAEIAGIENMLAEAPKRISEAKALLAQATPHISAVHDQGFHTDEYEQVLAGCATDIANAETLLRDQHAPKAACEKVQEVSMHVNLAVADAEGLPVRSQKIQASITAATARIESVKQAIVAGKGTFDDIHANFAEASWTSVRGNGTEAVKRVNRATDGVTHAQTASSMEAQEWQKAEKIVASANTSLDEAESFMRSIASLSQNLAQAKQEAPRELAAAKADIAKARAYIHQYDSDIRDNLEGDLRRDEQALIEAESELAQAKPDFLNVIKSLRQVHKTADDILGEARQEHETAERLRQKAASMLRDARSKVSTAREYIEDHRSDIETSTLRSFDQAKMSLHTAENSSESQRIISAAQEAEDSADRAYQEARDDFRDAEAARHPVHVETYGTWGSQPSGGGYSGGSIGGSFGGGGSSGGDSGGGSSSWGGSSGGDSGGGSSPIDSGGGGDAGGGSTSW